MCWVQPATWRSSDCCVHCTDEGVEAKNSTHLDKILPCFPIALRVEQSPFPWVLLLPTPHVFLSQKYSQTLYLLGTHISSSMLMISAHCVSFPLISTSSCLCGNATSSRKPPLMGSDYWGNSLEGSVPLCRALVVLGFKHTCTSLAPTAPDHGLPEVREGTRATAQNLSPRRKQPHATTG